MTTADIAGEKKAQRSGCALESCLSEARTPNVQAIMLITVSYSSLTGI